MKCLVAGAYGFIGRGVVAALVRSGHEVIGAGRDLDLGQRLVPGIEWIHCDFNHDLDPGLWAARLDGVEAVVNCVGILQSDLRDNAARVHGAGARALFKGAEEAGVSRLVHISATTLDETADGVEDETRIVPEYAASKLAGEAYLKATNLDWTIVRPDLVLGAQSTGGALLMRGLAGLPLMTPVPGDGGQKFQPVAIDDLADAVTALVEGGAHKGETIYAVGPETLTLREILLNFRRWLGFAGVPVLPVPRLLIKAMLLAGDGLALLGNRTALRSASLTQMERFWPHDSAALAGLIGREPVGMNEFLSQQPATFPDRMHARGFFLLPSLRWVVGLSWIFEGYEALVQSAAAAGIGTLALTAAVSWQGVAALLTMLCGVFFLSNRWMRIGGLVKAALIVAAGAVTMSYVDSFSQFLGVAFGVAVPVLLIFVLMGLNEKR